VRRGLKESISPSIGGRAYNSANNWNTTRSATATQKSDYEIASREFAIFQKDLQALLSGELIELEAALSAAGAPSWR
jgi:hypothetical protein